MECAYQYLEISIMNSLNRKQRNPWLDKLKAFAIYLVIVGHVLSNCMQNGGVIE